MWDKVEQTSTRTFCLHKIAISFFFFASIRNEHTNTAKWPVQRTDEAIWGNSRTVIFHTFLHRCFASKTARTGLKRWLLLHDCNCCRLWMNMKTLLVFVFDCDTECIAEIDLNRCNCRRRQCHDAGKMHAGIHSRKALWARSVKINEMHFVSARWMHFNCHIYCINLRLPFLNHKYFVSLCF